MAAGLGITKGALANIEAGRRVPGCPLSARYARVLRGLANHDEVSREPAVQEHLEAG